MRFLKWAGVWLLISFVIIVIEKKTGAFTYIWTLGGRVKTPLITS
jgi:hypothetical protein